MHAVCRPRAQTKLQKSAETGSGDGDPADGLGLRGFYATGTGPEKDEADMCGEAESGECCSVFPVAGLSCAVPNPGNHFVITP